MDSTFHTQDRKHERREFRQPTTASRHQRFVRWDTTTRSPLAVPRLSVDQYLSAMEEANTASINFLKVDLETALTFSRMALQASDPVKKVRNTRAARRAYDTISRLRGRVYPETADSEILSRNLRLLKSDLVLLGERV